MLICGVDLKVLIIEEKLDLGEHGQKRTKPSNYALQLSAKQKLKKYYGYVTERQFKKYYANRHLQVKEIQDKF